VPGVALIGASTCGVSVVSRARKPQLDAPFRGTQAGAYLETRRLPGMRCTKIAMTSTLHIGRPSATGGNVRKASTRWMLPASVLKMSKTH